MIRWLLSFFCRHEWSFFRTIYGDEAMFTGCRSVWRCGKCGYYQYREELCKEHNNE